MREIDQSQTLQFHAFLLGNTAERLTRFERALTQQISGGDVVLDLGSGTGVLAFLALRAGAGRVYAVEETDSIELARSVCAANGVNDRIVLLHSSSFSVELPEPADVLVADIFDIFGLQPGGLRCFADARRRLLKPSAALIPSALELYLAPVEAHELYEQRIDVWTREISGLACRHFTHARSTIGIRTTSNGQLC
jgi:predicted RNA methylase